MFCGYGFVSRRYSTPQAKQENGTNGGRLSVIHPDDRVLRVLSLGF